MAITDIVGAVADHFHVPVAELVGARRDRIHCERRAVAYHLCAELTDASLAEIGAAFNRDHSSVAKGLERPLQYSANCAIETLRETLAQRDAHAPVYVKRWPFRSRRQAVQPVFLRRYTA